MYILQDRHFPCVLNQSLSKNERALPLKHLKGDVDSRRLNKRYYHDNTITCY